MSDKPHTSRAVNAVLWLIGTLRGSAIYYGLFFIVLGSTFMREPPGSLGFSCGLMMTITGASCLGAGLLWREGRMYWVRWGMVILLGFTGILTIIFLFYQIFDLYQKL